MRRNYRYKTSPAQRAKASARYYENREYYLAQSKRHYLEHQEYHHECTRRWRQQNPERTQEIDTAAKARHRKRHPDRARARQTITWLLASGQITPQPCEADKNGRKCGVMPTQSHHPDYSRPLEIVWLCPNCHKALRSKGRKSVEVAA